ncbi:LysM peptidoglycan-binding domain-containing protein [Tranquillimonas alkanivorans]|uniref:LysM domain-containing protein n=1 Tax=Tranquillimonas alkanivorans TaxID=441119 RepID=A0A1I5WDT0_9RHOB|nr:LysM peptidoglycan-binding domain-containing protein [Tranquillimonas alkanivorans]SFQ17892.1 LysM domain-containing protein [Tranquillimonas alkanivorans]
MKRHHLVGASAFAIGVAASAASVQAQSRCGATYEIEPGDTLYQVTQQCRVSLSRIYELNDIGNPRDIEVGTVLRLEADAQAGADYAGDEDDTRSQARAEGSYRVQEGDTPYSVAQSLGISLMALLSENEDLDPLSMAVGEMLDVPDEDRNAAFNIQPLAGPVGSDVSVRARGLTPDSYVTIGAGPTSAEWYAITNAQVAADGEVSTEVQVPDWADPGDILTFVIDTDQGVTLKSRDFDVVAAEDEQRDRSGDEMSLEGRVRDGVECYTLTTPDGDLWSIVSDDVEFTAGEYVEVSGSRAEMSFCQQGVGTLDVEEIEEVPAP